ncbi:rho GTPase-activating protein 3-like [Malus sylvestris]|uniref:rho GTPase-activating protein 3-like n=1 Tax=Malus sylvestris TaxID=3752 RepID=UPI0021ACE124|nr:rho GTPase-activating protein 3-like [Malus sylvestris]
MARLFRSKSCHLVGLTEFSIPPPSPFSYHHNTSKEEEEEEEEEEEDDDEGLEYEELDFEDEEEAVGNPRSTPFLSPKIRASGNNKGRDFHGHNGRQHQHHQSAILDILVAALRKSLVTCSVERDDVASSFDISSPSEVRHVSHVTFDRFNGFLGLPTELEPEVPRKVPSASVSVFGVSAKSMQCSYDNNGNSVPTILLMMQERLYSGGGLKAEGIFRINAENGQEERLRDQLNKGIVPHGIDVHCLAGLIKAWFRELPTRVLDSLTPEQVMSCNTEDDCTELVKTLPPTEASLLDWAINLMADVAQNEQHNKMNARNIAMVFAPNMTEMADPLTALIHAVQVMNFLKTLILKTLRTREESAAEATLHASCKKSLNHNRQTMYSIMGESFVHDSSFSTATLDSPKADINEKLWCSPVMTDGEDELESTSHSSASTKCELECSENGCRSGYEAGDWLSWRKGVRKLSSHLVFQLSKPAKKSTKLEIVNTRGEGGEAWA